MTRTSYALSNTASGSVSRTTTPVICATTSFEAIEMLNVDPC
jgi:hypothetical protein